MQLQLCTSMGYYLCGFHRDGATFTNKKELAKNLTEYSIEEFQEIKESIEDKLHCELDMVFN